MFACRTCQFSEPATSACVFRNDLQNSVGEVAGVTQDVGSDPTVGLPEFCTLCGQEIVCVVCGEVMEPNSDKHRYMDGVEDEELLRGG